MSPNISLEARATKDEHKRLKSAKKINFKEKIESNIDQG